MAKTIELEPQEGISAAIRRYGVAQETAMALRQHFEPFEKKAKEWAEKAQRLTVTDRSQVGLMKQAREARLVLKGIRGEITAKHRELKEEALRKGQVLDQIKRSLNGLIEPIEEYLERQENFEQIQEEEAKAKLQFERVEALAPYMGSAADSMPLSDMSQDAFENLLEGMKAARERKEQADREEAERVKREAERRAEEDRRIREENARLSKERAELAAKAEAERKQREKLEADAHARAEAEERQRKAVAAAERRAKRAPDKTKLLDWAEQIESLWMKAGDTLKFKDEEAQRIFAESGGLLRKTVKYVKDNAGKL